MDMGVIMLGDSKSEQLDILGNNLTSSLSLSWAIGGIFELSDYEVSAQEVHDGCTVEISCREPEERRISRYGDYFGRGH